MLCRAFERLARRGCGAATPAGRGRADARVDRGLSRASRDSASVIEIVGSLPHDQIPGAAPSASTWLSPPTRLGGRLLLLPAEALRVHGHGPADRREPARPGRRARDRRTSSTGLARGAGRRGGAGLESVARLRDDAQRSDGGSGRRRPKKPTRRHRWEDVAGRTSCASWKRPVRPGPGEWDVPPAAGRSAGARAGYVLKRYPRLSETFIVSELLGVERAGHQACVLASSSPKEPRVHPAVAEVRGEVTYFKRPARRRLRKEAGRARSRRAGAVRQRESRRSCWPGARGDGGRPVSSLHRRCWSPRKSERRGSRPSPRALRDERRSHRLPRLAHQRRSVQLHRARQGHLPTRRRPGGRRSSFLDRCAFVVAISELPQDFLRRMARGRPDRGRAQRPRSRTLPLPGRAAGARSGPLRLLAVGPPHREEGLRRPGRGLCPAARAGSRARLPLRRRGRRSARARAAHRAARPVQSRSVSRAPAPRTSCPGYLGWASVLAAPCVTAESGDKDGLPTVILEAMAAGLPVVSTPVTAIPEIVRDGETGRLVPRARPGRSSPRAFGRLADDPRSRRAAGAPPVAPGDRGAARPPPQRGATRRPVPGVRTMRVKVSLALPTMSEWGALQPDLAALRQARVALPLAPGRLAALPAAQHGHGAGQALAAQGRVRSRAALGDGKDSRPSVLPGLEHPSRRREDLEPQGPACRPWDPERASSCASARSPSRSARARPFEDESGSTCDRCRTTCARIERLKVRLKIVDGGLPGQGRCTRLGGSGGWRLRLRGPDRVGTRGWTADRASACSALDHRDRPKHPMARVWRL